jgi:hypothetical protein
MNSEGAGGYGNRSCIAAVGDRERGSIYSAHLQCVDFNSGTSSRKKLRRPGDALIDKSAIFTGE